MLKIGEKVVFKCTMAELILLYILLVHGYQVKAVSLIQGQEATLQFPYPCDSTKITLQQSNRAPFYRSSDGSSLSLSQDQVLRFKVQNRNNTDNCSLDFTISNLQSIDQGTYILLVYKEGNILLEHMHRIWLQVHYLYPPGKASCVVSEDKGGEWVSIDCTANVGSLSGKIECYQDSVWIPPLTDLNETDTTLKQTFLIRKSHPVFCCSSPLPRYIERCECNDTALYQDDTSSSDPCSTITTKASTTSTYRTPDLVEKSQSSNPSQTTSTNANKMTKNNLKAIIIIYYIFATGVVILLILNAISLYRLRQERKNNSNDESQDLKAIIIHYILGSSVVILLLILNAISLYRSRQERKNNSNDESQELIIIIIYYILGSGVVILLILNVISLYQSRQERKQNSDESQNPSLSGKVHGHYAQKYETGKLNQIQFM